jgi:uncharacterized repeat protein (TIGR01451 family)
MRVKLRSIKCLAGLLMLAGVEQAYAAGTVAGTSINNSATVDFTVGGINQPDVSSNIVTFVVDRRINLTVAESGGAATNVVPGANDQVLTFTLTNSTNAVMDFRLSATQDATGATTAFSDSDNFDAANVRVFVESGATAGYQAAEDTATYVDELVADGTRTVYIVANIPAGQVNGDTAGFTLRAYAAQSGTAGSLGADSTETTGADTAGVDTVFGDGAGDTDSARDGSHSDDDEYDLVAAQLVVVKSTTIISDPFNNTTNPKAIPGAVIEYCIDINNSGASAADAIVLTDTIPGNATYVPGSIQTAVTGSGTSCTNGTGSSEDDNAAGADETDPNGADFGITQAGAVTVRAPSVAAGARFKTLFRVTIN